MTASELDVRYGRTPERQRRTRLLALVAAVGVGVVVVAWVFWAGLFSPAASLETKDIGFRTLSDTAVEVDWQLTAPAGAEVSCAVKAVSEKHAVIGWKVVEVEPSDRTTRKLTVELRTSEFPNGGSVFRCWLTNDDAAPDAGSADLP